MTVRGITVRPRLKFGRNRQRSIRYEYRFERSRTVQSTVQGTVRYVEKCDHTVRNSSKVSTVRVRGIKVRVRGRYGYVGLRYVRYVGLRYVVWYVELRYGGPSGYVELRYGVASTVRVLENKVPALQCTVWYGMGVRVRYSYLKIKYGFVKYGTGSAVRGITVRGTHSTVRARGCGGRPPARRPQNPQPPTFRLSRSPPGFHFSLLGYGTSTVEPNDLYTPHADGRP